MNFDVKDLKSWANRHDVKNNDKGYFAKSISQLQNDKHVELTTVYSINDDMGACFIPKGWGTGFDFFLPVDAVKEDKPKEKKYRPLKSIDEMDCLFDCSVMSAKNFLTYRNKASGKIYIELLFSVCRDKDDILRSINNIPVQNLFNYFEIKKNGEWLPFGIEVKDDE
jgi:hypothetical protein